MQPAAYCYQILRCAVAATTSASGPLVPTTYACLSIFCHKLPACAIVSTLPLSIILPRDESSVWRDTAADSGGCRPGLGSNWFQCSGETL